MLTCRAHNENGIARIALQVSVLRRNEPFFVTNLGRRLALTR
jgi:hypothetical protein